MSSRFQQHVKQVAAMARHRSGAGPLAAIARLSWGLVLMAVFMGPAMAQDAQPGFFQRLGHAAKQGVNDAFHPGQASSQDMYRVVQSGPVHFAGLFNGTPRPGYSATVGWPRAAVTFTRYGAKEACWSGQVVIWTNARSSSAEAFEVCATPSIVVNDAAGHAQSYDPHSADEIALHFINQSAPERENTGTQRTTGPLPPLHPFKLVLQDYSMNQRTQTAAPNALGAHIDMTSMADRYTDILLRLAVVSGYAQPEDFSSRTTVITDSRLWVVGFAPQTPP